MSTVRTEHTQGPWEWTDFGDDCLLLEAGHTRVIGTVYDEGRAPFVYVENPADRALIAAAPDLLAALKAVVQASRSEAPLADMHWAVIGAQQAIAKAAQHDP